MPSNEDLSRTTEMMRCRIGRYRDTLRRLERRSAEVQRWREMALRTPGIVSNPHPVSYLGIA